MNEFVIQPRPPAQRRLRELAVLCDYDPDDPIQEEMRDLARYTFSLVRWPDEAYDDSLGRDLQALWDLAGDTAEDLPWDFPHDGLVPGNDYIDSTGHVLRTANICPEPRCATPQPGPHTGYCKHSMMRGGQPMRAVVA